jgi:hypothetical protein
MSTRCAVERAAAQAAGTLSEQEVRIRHFHREIDRYIGGKK